MAANSLHELFIEELRDMYDAEKRLLRAIPKMAKAATSRELEAALTNHLQETEGQVDRLEQVFEALGERPRGKKCDGMMGIVEEGNTAIEELEKGPILDAALIAGAQKVEHYEISSYGTLAYFAELLGEEQCKELLGETLEEEKAADEKLNEIAKSRVNREALMSGAEAMEEGEDEEEPARGRRSFAEMGVAQDRAAARATGRKSTGRSSSSGRKAGSSRSTSTRGRSKKR